MNFDEGNEDEIAAACENESVLLVTTRRKPKNVTFLEQNVSVVPESVDLEEIIPSSHIEELQNLPTPKVSHRIKIKATATSKDILQNVHSHSHMDVLLETKSSRGIKLDSNNNTAVTPNTENEKKIVWIKKYARKTFRRKSKSTLIATNSSSLKFKRRISFKRKMHEDNVYSDVAGSVSGTDSMASSSTLPSIYSSATSMAQSVKDLINSKSAEMEFYEEQFSEIEIPSRPKTFRWLREKIRRTKAKRLSQFEEKHRLCFLSDGETGQELSSGDKEHEDEWLEYTGSDTSYDQDLIERPLEHSNLLELNPESYILYKSLKSYFLILKIFGRLPFNFQRVEESKSIKTKIVKSSWNYCLFCFTSTVLTLVMGLFITGCLQTYSFHSSYNNLYENVEKLILDKYWLPGLVTGFSMAQLVVWSFSVIFQDGIFLEDYLTRWSLALSVIEYSPDNSLKLHLRREYIAFCFYSLTTTLLFFFGGENFTMFWGNAELIAMNVFKLFINQPRFHKWFYMMRIVGHLIFLYCIFCSRLITIMILVHCRLVESTARRFNLRLACIIEKIAIVKKDDTYSIKTRVIPYMKLFSEHLVVTSFSRHTGRVFLLPAAFYFLVSGIVLFLSLRNIGLNFVLGFPQKNETHVENLPEGFGKILYFDRPIAKFLQDVFIAGQCLISFLVSTEIISKCGSVIMTAKYFLRRHGMLLCRSSNERRFILSMQNSLSPALDYNIDFGFRVDRPFVYKFLSGVICLLIITIRFSPVRLQTQSITHCSNGVCRQVSFPKYARRMLQQLHRNATLL